MLPSTSERITLTLNGLGEKKLQFPWNGNAAQVHEVIIDVFPALQTAGGYEVLRTVDGRSKDLICIPTPASGMSVPFLKSVLGQAKGFLRPLQKDIVIQAELPEGKAAPCSQVGQIRCEHGALQKWVTVTVGSRNSEYPCSF